MERKSYFGFIDQFATGHINTPTNMLKATGFDDGTATGASGGHIGGGSIQADFTASS